MKSSITAKSFVESLALTNNVNRHFAFIESTAKHGDIETLRRLFVRTREECDFGPSAWAPRAVCERIVETLALTDGYENAAAAVELAKFHGGETGSSRVRLPAVISRLVAGQSSRVLIQLLEQALDIESEALILHEGVVRRKLPAEAVPVQQSARRLELSEHALSFLPLSLTELESDVLLPNYGVGSQSASIPFGPWEIVDVRNLGAVDADVLITETTTPERAERIGAATKNWQEASNGVIEARAFAIRSRQRVTAVPSLIRMLGLESIATCDTGAYRVNSSPREVFTQLFSAASSGGAYNSGEYAAYGRLSAWRSLSGLVGCDENVAVDEIAAQASSCDWCLFCVPSEWYFQVAWDIGVACANPARNEMTILAATDTD
jgi:hypothetical protein